MASITFGVVGLAMNILQVIQEVQKAQGSVRGTSKTLTTVAYQLNSTSKSLVLIRDEPNLHTPSVEQQLTMIVGIAEELKAFFNRLHAIQSRRTMRRFAHAVNSGDSDERSLTRILTQLDGARNELILRISVAQVGLMGSLKEGFRVNNNILMDTNRKCKMILGRELALANQVKGRRVPRDGKLPLDQNDVRRLRLTDPANLPRRTNIVMQDNITMGSARIAVGDIGCCPPGWDVPREKNGVISGNQFGNGLHMMVGDVHGEAAAGFFHSNFWD